MAIMAMLFMWQATFAIAIGPIKSFYNAAAGETMYGNIVVINIAEEGSKIPQVETDIPDWISFPQITEQQKTFNPIAPGDRAAIIYQIDVPQDTAPGEYYGKILVSDIPAPSDENSQGAMGVSLNFQISHLIYIKIEGEDVSSNVVFEDFNITKNTETNAWNFTNTFSNNGDIHDIPTGNIIILENNAEDNFSAAPIIEMDLNPNQKGIVPQLKSDENQINPQTITAQYEDAIEPGDYIAIIKTKTTNNAAEARINFTINEDIFGDDQNLVTLFDQEITSKNPDEIQLQDLSKPKNLTTIEVKEEPSIRFSHAFWFTLLVSLGLSFITLRLTSKPKNK